MGETVRCDSNSRIRERAADEGVGGRAPAGGSALRKTQPHQAWSTPRAESWLSSVGGRCMQVPSPVKPFSPMKLRH